MLYNNLQLIKTALVFRFNGIFPIHKVPRGAVSLASCAATRSRRTAIQRS